MSPNTIPECNLGSDNQVAVVLIEPCIPQNTGNIARLCACAGAELYLVGNLGFQLGEKYLRRAGMDYLGLVDIRHVNTFEAVLEEKPGWQAYFLSSKVSKNYSTVAYQPKTLLVFGNETQGLPSAWLEAHPDTSIRIPMTKDARSLNLSNAVAIVLYEYLRQVG